MEYECEHHNKRSFDIVEYTPSGQSDPQAYFSYYPDCGRIIFIRDYKGKISSVCPKRMYAQVRGEEKGNPDRGHRWTRSQLDMNSRGVRVCYECTECGASVYGYEPVRGSGNISMIGSRPWFY